MADADVIPIGGKGAAGRGSRTSPSAAARALAPATGRRAGGAKAARPPRAVRKPDPLEPAVEESLEELASVERDPGDGERAVSERDLERRVAELLAFLRR